MSKHIQTESQMSTWVRLNAPKYGTFLMRNNSGVLINPDTNRPVRFGLGNDSKKLNTVFKSSDLIGITPKQCRCGETHGVFTALEIKKPGWKPNPNDSVYIAQNAFIHEVIERKGVAGFISSTLDLIRILEP